MVEARTRVLGFGLVWALLLGAPTGVEAKTTTAKVTKVADGDSLTLVAGGKKRKLDLAGVDAPELVGDAATTCFGSEALKHLRALLPRGAKVALRGVRGRSGEVLRGKASVNRS